MRLGLRTTVAAAAVAVSAAAFCPGAALASFTFTPSGHGPSFTVKDKLFSNFTCVSANPGCGAVSYASASPLLGTTINPALAQFSTGTEDVLLKFEVSTTSGKALINDLLITSDSVQTGSGIISDTLKVCTTAGCSTILFQTVLTGNDLGIHITGAPQSALWISEDMNAHVGSGPGIATMTSITKSVSEVTTPEPASLALLGVGLLGLGLTKRRKVK